MSFSIQNMGHPLRSWYCVSSRFCGNGPAGGGGKVVRDWGRGGGGGNGGPLGLPGEAAWTVKLGTMQGGLEVGALGKARSRLVGSRWLLKTRPCTGSPKW